jgi:TolB protein
MLISLLFSALAIAAPTERTFEIPVAGSQEMPLALPKPLSPPGTEVQAAMVWETVYRDLEMAGYFKLIDHNLYLEKGKGVAPGTFDWSDWSEAPVEAHALAKLQVLPAGHADCDPGGIKMCVDVYVYYVLGKEELLSKRFRAEKDTARRLGHRAANVILEAIVGEPGFFHERIGAVGAQAGNKEIYVLDVDGKKASRVTRNGTINLSPAWSPDGNYVAWTSYKRGNPDLYIKNVRSGDVRVLSNRQGINASPAFGPDDVLALTRSRDGDSDIFLINAKTGKDLKQITKGGGIDVAPNFSPDGKKIVYASERSGGSQIYIYDRQTGKSERATFQGDFNMDPAFSPDGTKIAFVGRNAGFNVYVLDIATKRVTAITTAMGDNEDPAWSPDGKYLLFSSTRTGLSDLYISTADGRHQVRVTRTGGWTQPTWRP